MKATLGDMAVWGAILLALPLGSPTSDAISLVSVALHHEQSNHASLDAVVCGEGRYVAFRSTASNLTPNDNNGCADIFVRDRASHRTVCASVTSSGAPSNGDSFLPALSADGRFLAFQSLADNLVVGDTNQAWDVFMHDLLTRETWRISENAFGAQGNADSLSPSISADGRYVAFFSYASNLAYNDHNGCSDVFVCDTWMQVLVRVSVNSSGAEAGGSSEFPAISQDGRYIAFQCVASDLVSGDTNGAMDIFVHDILIGLTGRVSLNDDAREANGPSLQATISGNGRVVAFQSAARNLVPGDTNDQLDIFVRDVWLGITRRASVDARGVESNGKSGQPSLSDNGLRLVFASDAANLVPGDTNGVRDLFLCDLTDGAIECINLAPDGAEANGSSDHPALSFDGEHVAFGSVASNLIWGDVNGYTDAFVYDTPKPVEGRQTLRPKRP